MSILFLSDFQKCVSQSFRSHHATGVGHEQDENGDTLESIKFEINLKEYYRLDFTNDRLVFIGREYVYHELIKEMFPDPKEAVEKAIKEQSKQ